MLPRRYDLSLTPDLAAATFSGEVDVDVEVAEPTAEVVLNAIELEIDEAWITVGTARHDATVTLDEASERATLTVPTPLPPGDAVVSLRFRGQLNDKLRGFYRSTFTDDDGNERVIATTQFEATDARRAFPCWDEPDFKARFAITLHLEDDLRAVSNAAVDPDEVIDGQRRVRFAETMTMSTYLVAFIVGPLEVTEPVDVAGTPLRLLCPPGKLHLTPFGLDVASSPSPTWPTTSTSPTRATRWTWWPSPTSRSGPWRTSAASPSGRRCSSRTRSKRPRASSRTSWT